MKQNLQSTIRELRSELIPLGLRIFVRRIQHAENYPRILALRFIKNRSVMTQIVVLMFVAWIRVVVLIRGTSFARIWLCSIVGFVEGQVRGHVCLLT